jgi:hypothetical protein
MILLCEENDKYGGQNTEYYIVKKVLGVREAHRFSLRSRINPELTYYITELDEDGVNDGAILTMFKKETSRKPPMFVMI